MPPFNYPLKRSYDCEVPFNPKFGQGISQPCIVSPHPNLNNAKRQKPTEMQVSGHLNRYEGSINLSDVHNQPEQASLKVNADPRLAYTERTRPCSMEDASSVTNNSLNTLGVPISVKPFASNDSQIRSDPSWNLSSKEATPTSESYTLGSSSSTGERAEWIVDTSPPLATYSYPELSGIGTEEDISHVTGNSGRGGNFGSWNSCFDSPDIPSSSPTSTKDYRNSGPTHTHNPDFYIEGQNMNCECMRYPTVVEDSDSCRDPRKYHYKPPRLPTIILRA